MTCMQLDSPVGPLLLAASRDGLTHVLFAGSEGRPRRAKDRPRGDGSAAAGRILEDARAQLGEYFDGTRRSFDLPLALAGTAFQREVWRALSQVGYGELQSYGALANAVGRARSVRAVGAANGANPVSIIVPCHRVVGQNRRLTGYAGGLAAKRTLLQLEGVGVEGDRIEGQLR